MEPTESTEPTLAEETAETDCNLLGLPSFSSSLKHHLKRLAIPVLATLVGAASLVWVSGVFADKVSPGERALPERSIGAESARVSAKVTPVPQYARAMGTLQARHDAVVASKVTTRILEVLVRPGDRVTKGELLLRLDARDVRARVSAAHHGVAVAKAELTRAEQNARRSTALLQGGVETGHEHDAAMANLAVAQARVKQAREQVRAERSLSAYTELRAPRDGVVIEKHADVGDLALPGQPLLSVYDPGALRLEAAVRESHLRSLRIGDELEVRIDAAGDVVTGVVEEIVPRATSTTRTFLVRIALPANGELYPGMFGSVLIPRGTADKLLVPGRAVRRIGQVELIELVREDGTLERRHVMTGERLGDDVEILSGLSAAEAATVALLRH